MRFCLAVVVSLLFTIAAAAQDISTPAKLLAAMHDRYTAKWYRTLTFEQQSITHKSDGSQSTEIWHEAILLPGRLRIDIGDRASGDGMLFLNNHLYTYRNGKLAADRDYIHPLLVLGFDVYMQPVETTMQQLKDLHFDLSSLHEESFNGRPAYVVGAKKGDLQTLQFWVDKDGLYFVRLLQPGQKQPSTIQDIRFDQYRRVEGGGWVAEHVEDITDGKLVFEERYSDVKVNVPLKEDLFDPGKFAEGMPAGQK